MKKIMIVGGAGYIGSVTNRYLREKGYETVIFDSMEGGHDWAIGETLLVKGNLQEREVIGRALETEKPDGVIHFAAYIQMGESYADPGKYYRNNVLGSLNLLEAMTEAGVKKLVFSSSAGVYGSPKAVPIKEETLKNPENPYGQTKWDMEKMMGWFDKAHQLRFIALRYFNACGAVVEWGLGEAHQPESHIIPIFLKRVSSGQQIQINGKDYRTEDKTCVRDYVHVLDLASAHYLALEALFEGSASEVYNVGTGHGYSNLEIAEKILEVTGKKVSITYGPRRPGDADSLVADSTKIKSKLGWNPEHSDLETIIKSAWEWEQNKG